MMKLRARSRSFGSKDDTRSPKQRGGEKSNHNSESNSSQAQDDINIKPSGSSTPGIKDNINSSNSNNRVEFPLELARSLQSFAASLSLPSSSIATVASPLSSSAKRSKEASSSSSATPSTSTSKSQLLRTTPPLKPILRSSATSEARKDASNSSRSRHSRQSSSISSTGSSKQISFLLPESPTRWGAATAPEFPGRSAAPRSQSGSHSRQSSASSTGSFTPSKGASSASTISSKAVKVRQVEHKYSSAVPILVPVPEGPLPAPPPPVSKEDDIIHIRRPPSIMHIRRVSDTDTPEVRRSSIELLSKELPPLPLNASAPASSIPSRTSSRQSGHVRNESASSAASSLLSNPIHLPRLKLGEPSLGFPTNLLSPSPESPASQRSGEERNGYSPFDDKRFNWMGMGRKRDSSESKRSSKRRSESSVVGSLHSLPMNKHQRSRSSQLDIVPESEDVEFTMHAAPLYTQEVPRDRPAFERSLTSSSKNEAARMTQLWVSLLEDFVLLCDDPTVPSSKRTSASSTASSFVPPPSPLSSALLNLPPSAPTAACPLSPSPSSECDPFLRLPRSARKNFASVSKPLPPSPIPSLEVDDSAGSTVYTQSPTTPAEESSTSPNLPATASFNPFEASFSSADIEIPSSPQAPTSCARRASLPGTLAPSSSAYGEGRPGKVRPPPLQLSTIPDSSETIHTAVAPQTEAQTHFYTSQRSRSLPTSKLEPGTYRQPISPSFQRDLDAAEQLGASTSSNGSNRASRRYHFPSSTTYGANALKSSTTSSTGATTLTTRRNKSIDEGYEGTGLTPTPTSDTFSIPSRSRETSVSSRTANSRRRRSSCTTAETSIPSPTLAAEAFTEMMIKGFSTEEAEGKTTPDNRHSSTTPPPQKSSDSSSSTSNQSTPNANRRKEPSKTRSTRSQSASEHVRKRSHDAGAMKRSPTLEIVMYGVAL